MVKVSRPSLYNHISEKEIPKSIDDYQSIYELALLVENSIHMDIRLGLKSVLVNGRTLLGYLKASPKDHARIVEVCNVIAEKLAERKAPESQISSEQQRIASRAVTRIG